MTPDIDKLIDDCIDSLIDDDIRKGGDCLEQLARHFAKAGLGLKSFTDMRTFIINQAVEQTDAIFIKEKLELAERDSRTKRTGSIIIH
ncbi:MAG: hypothetical protein HRU18_16785 [Pseudoalteromonas sp.]|uniref:hypothetical protein n=1 Tax=Pseudoalteromonas sp. TaxID=53249 RepID=UPI001DD736BF|nr:hypothetical protein [Pseudoalteromonas sp.]NRA79863.1 hypothetical protein [Pseudoalteromonas sp.]